MHLAWLTLLLLFASSSALIGYDCGKSSPNVTTFSLKEIEQCQYQRKDPTVQNLDIQLLQKIEHIPVYIISCRIKVKRDIKYCDWLNVATTVNLKTFYEKISEETCKEIHRSGKFDYEKITVRELIVNATNQRAFRVAGKIDSDGDCSGSTYNTDGEEYSSAVVWIELEIDLTDATVAANRDKEEIILPSGARCALKNTKCIDRENNYVFWAYQPKPVCDFEQYALLFEGRGVKIGNASEGSQEVYFANSTDEIQFGLTKTGETYLCGYKIYSTEHAKFYITEYTPNRGPPVKKQIETEDVILTAYFDTKIALLAKHIKSQFINLYKDIVENRCKLEKQVIENALLHIHTKPDIVAIIIMKKRGYFPVLSGEVAHMVACEPIQCKIRHISECYQEIPASCGNESYFLKPQSHIIMKTGTPTDCNAMLPVMFEIDNTWRQLMPTVSVALEPQKIKPTQKLAWEYQDLQGLVNSGIYKQRDLDKLREHILFPAQKPALLEEVARKLSESSASNVYTAKFRNLLDT